MNVRLTHSTFLKNLKSDYNALYHRLADMAALNVPTFDGFQVVFYVPGGMIRVHNDFLHKIVSL